MATEPHLTETDKAHAEGARRAKEASDEQQETSTASNYLSIKRGFVRE